MEGLQPRSKKRVKIGSRVRIAAPNGEPLDLQLVTPGEIDLDSEVVWISLSSPLGLALRGRSEGEKVELETPSGNRTYEIVHVE